MDNKKYQRSTFGPIGRKKPNVDALIRRVIPSMEDVRKIHERCERYKNAMKIAEAEMTPVHKIDAIPPWVLLSLSPEERMQIAKNRGDAKEDKTEDDKSRLSNKYTITMDRDTRILFYSGTEIRICPGRKEIEILFIIHYPPGFSDKDQPHSMEKSGNQYVKRMTTLPWESTIPECKTGHGKIIAEAAMATARDASAKSSQTTPLVIGIDTYNSITLKNKGLHISISNILEKPKNILLKVTGKEPDEKENKNENKNPWVIYKGYVPSKEIENYFVSIRKKFSKSFLWRAARLKDYLIAKVVFR